MLVHDLPDVMAIERHSHNSAWSDNNFKSEMRNDCAHAFVAHEEHRIVGYLVFWLVHDEVYLLNLTVHKDFRRCGLGQKLVAFLIDFSRHHGARWIGLEVRKSNHSALSIYGRFGFRQERVRKAYYQDNHEDGIVMELEL